jgi:hypothetical protein
MINFVEEEIVPELLRLGAEAAAAVALLAAPEAFPALGPLVAPLRLAPAF